MYNLLSYKLYVIQYCDIFLLCYSRKIEKTGFYMLETVNDSYVININFLKYKTNWKQMY